MKWRTLRTLSDSTLLTCAWNRCNRGNKQIGTDLDEDGLIEIIDSHKKALETKGILLLLSPMGSRISSGRGNLQLSADVLRRIGIDAILGVVLAKLATLNSLRIDTGDAELDTQFRERKYLKALQGYRTTRLIRISAD